MRTVLLFCLLTVAATAQAAHITLKPYHPAPAGLFPMLDLPGTFVTGFDVNGNITGVCGYYGNGGAHVAYSCTWDTAGNPIAIGARLSGWPSPVYGPVEYMQGIAVFVVATDSNQNTIGVIDSAPRAPVLVTP